MCGFQGGGGFAVIAAGTQAGGAEARVLEHQVQFGDQQQGVENKKSRQRQWQQQEQ